MGNLSLEERMAAYEKNMQKSLDYVEIQNVFALHEYYHHVPTEEIEMIFARKQPDVSFGQNWGIWVGLETIKKYYYTPSREERQKKLEALRKAYPDIPDDIEYADAGGGGFHMLTTPLIEIAEDGETAKGMWYTPGYLTLFSAEANKHVAVWIFEKYAVDFIKEDGKWKIWHFNVYCDFLCHYDKSWVETSLEGGSGFSQSIAVEASLPPIGYEKYHTRRIQPMDFPQPPVPYSTFSETFSYGPTREQLAELKIAVNY